MAEVEVLIKDKDEKAKAFNKRLYEQCVELLPCGADLSVVSGIPVVTLQIECEEADAEDVKAGDAEKIGDPILAGAAVCCAVCLVDADNAASAEKTLDRFDKLFDIAGAGVEDLIIKSGLKGSWVETPNAGAAVWVLKEVSYALLVWETDPEEIDDEDKSEKSTGKKEDTSTEPVAVEKTDDTKDAATAVTKKTSVKPKGKKPAKEKPAKKPEEETADATN